MAPPSPPRLARSRPPPSGWGFRPASAPARTSARAAGAASILLLTLAGAGGGLGSGCAVTSTLPPTRNLPPYSGSQARLFDDSLSLRLANPAIAGDGEGLLRARAAEADVVVRGRLRSVNERNVGNRSLLSLVFVWEQILAGPEPRGETVTVELRRGTPSHALVRSRRSQLMGAPVILFLKWFRDDDEPRLHARVEPDDPSVRDAVITARM